MAKWVVFESMIDQFLEFFACPNCANKVGRVHKTPMGTSLCCLIFCKNNHLVCDWESQPVIGKLPAFNNLFTAAISFSSES